MFTRKMLRGGLALVVLLGAWLIAGPAAVLAAAQGDGPRGELPRFEETPCPFPMTPIRRESGAVQCGALIVPEDRADPAGRVIGLAVVILRPPGGASQPDPIVYLSGGPGSSALANLQQGVGYFAPMLALDRDLILFDQRGVGFSQPQLACPGYQDLFLELLDWELDGRVLAEDVMDGLFRDEAAACLDGLAAGANLAAYHSAASAADINDLRQVLGYDQLNLWGISYGSRLALTVLRDTPSIVRSAVIDSVYPPDVNLYVQGPANADRAFSALFEGCAADPACNAAYPDLRTVFFQAVERLDELPAIITTRLPGASQGYAMLLDGGRLVDFIFNGLYITDLLPALPGIIYEVAAEDYDTVAQLYLAVNHLEGISLGMYYAVQCHEEAPFTSLAEFQAALDAYPELATRYRLEQSVLNVCNIVDVGAAAPLENAPVTSDVPVLLLSGEYDPITPPVWAAQAAAALSNAYHYTFPGVGHGVYAAGTCPRAMMAAFLADPRTPPEAACIDEMGAPRWAAP